LEKLRFAMQIWMPDDTRIPAGGPFEHGALA
jgi:hypothetical protein